MQSSNKSPPLKSQPYTGFTVTSGPASRLQSHNTSIESVEGVPSRNPGGSSGVFLNNRRVPAKWATGGGSSLPTTPKVTGNEGGTIVGLAPVGRLTPGPIHGGSPSSVSSANSSVTGFPSAPSDGYGRKLPTNPTASIIQLQGVKDAHNTSVQSQNSSDCPQVSQRRPPLQPQHKAALLRNTLSTQQQLRANPPSYHTPIQSNTYSSGYSAEERRGASSASAARQPSVQSDASSGSLRKLMGPSPMAPPSAQSVRVRTVQGRPVPMASQDPDRSIGSNSRPPLSHRSTSSADSGGAYAAHTSSGSARFTTASRGAPPAFNPTASHRLPTHSDPYDRIPGRSGSAANSERDQPPSRGSSDNTPGRQKKPPTEPAPLEHRLKQREKQLKLGRVTEGYRNYRLLVPFHDRQQGNPDHPTTPDPTTECSKRQWDTLISCWRRDLHRWDAEDDASRKAMKSLRTDGDLGRVPYEDAEAYRKRTEEELQQLYAEINDRHNPQSAPITPDLAPQSGAAYNVTPFHIGGMGHLEVDPSAPRGGSEFGVIGGTFQSKGGTDCSSCASAYDPNRYRPPGSGAASVGAASLDRKASSRYGSDHTLGSSALVAEPDVEDVVGRQLRDEHLAIWQAQVTLPKGTHASTDSTDGASMSITSAGPAIHVRVLAKDLWHRADVLACGARDLLTARTSGTILVPLTPPTQNTLQRPPSDESSLDSYTACLLSALSCQFNLESMYMVPENSTPTRLDTDAGMAFFRDHVKRILRESVPPPGTTASGDEFWASVVLAFPVLVYADELIYNPSMYSAHQLSSIGARSSHPSPIICRPEDDEGSDIDIPYATPRAHSSDDEQSPEISEMLAVSKTEAIQRGDTAAHHVFPDTGRVSAHDPTYVSTTPEFSEVLLAERWLRTPEEDKDVPKPGTFVGSGALLDVNETGGSCSPVHEV